MREGQKWKLSLVVLLWLSKEDALSVSPLGLSFLTRSCYIPQGSRMRWHSSNDKCCLIALKVGSTSRNMKVFSPPH